MKLTAEQIQENWNVFMGNIEKYISSPRKEKLIAFYEKYQERISLMPAAHKKEYHNAFPGGYVEHVNRVVRCALKQYDIWEEEGADMSTFTKEELVFSAINHDLGKMGDEENESYIPQTDKWRKDKLGEDYMFNKQVPFASVPDRGLFMLQSHGVQYTFNEMLAIQTHDGLYDEANKKSEGAKVFFKLKKGDINIIDLNLRYKGGFTSQPQFQATISADFKDVLTEQYGKICRQPK